MKKIIWIVVILVIILGIVWVINGASQESEKTIKIGVIIPLTGKGAVWGESVSNGVQLAMEEINAAGGVLGKDIEVIMEDDQLDVKRSISAFNKLIDIDGAFGVIGPGGSANAKGVAPLFLERQIPSILSAVGVSDITIDNPYIFRIWPSEVMKVKAMKPVIEKMGYKKVAIVTTNHEANLDISEQLKEIVLEPFGVEVALEEIVDRQEMDFRSVLTKIKTTEFDALFVNLYVGQTGTGIKQARELGIEQPIFSNVTADSPKELELSEGAMEGTWFPAAPIPTDDFLQRYKDRFGVDSELAAPSS